MNNSLPTLFCKHCGIEAMICENLTWIIIACRPCHIWCQLSFYADWDEDEVVSWIFKHFRKEQHNGKKERNEKTSVCYDLRKSGYSLSQTPKWQVLKKKNFLYSHKSRQNRKWNRRHWKKR